MPRRPEIMVVWSAVGVRRKGATVAVHLFAVVVCIKLHRRSRHVDTGVRAWNYMVLPFRNCSENSVPYTDASRQGNINFISHTACWPSRGPLQVSSCEAVARLELVEPRSELLVRLSHGRVRLLLVARPVFVVACSGELCLGPRAGVCPHGCV